ncbi:hypothetical protein [Corallococcus carmarthensis]
MGDLRSREMISASSDWLGFQYVRSSMPLRMPRRGVDDTSVSVVEELLERSDLLISKIGMVVSPTGGPEAP